MTNFGRLSDFVERALNVESSGLFFVVFSQKEAKNYIIKLNLAQLWEGVDANEVELSAIGGDYTDLTKFIKSKKGQPTNRVTLRDTGEFYESFKVEVEDDYFEITANYEKDLGVDLRDRWGDNLAGLSEHSIEKLRKFVIPAIQKYLTIYLLGQD